MKTIFRYPIPLEVFLGSGRVEIPMPKDAKILHLALQERAPHAPSLWVELDEGDKNATRVFEIVGTGHTVPENGVYIGTWQQAGYVWHLYEIQENDNG